MAVDIVSYREMYGLVSVPYHDDAAFVVERDELLEYTRDFKQRGCIQKRVLVSYHCLSVSVISGAPCLEYAGHAYFGDGSPQLCNPLLFSHLP